MFHKEKRYRNQFCVTVRQDDPPGQQTRSGGTRPKPKIVIEMVGTTLVHSHI